MIEGYLILKIIRGVTGSVSLLAGLWVMLNNNNVARYLSPLNIVGGMTLSIYILQTFILEKWIGPMLNFDKLPFLEFNFIVAPLMALGVLAICALLTKLIRLNRYCSLVLIGEIDKNHAKK